MAREFRSGTDTSGLPLRAADDIDPVRVNALVSPARSIDKRLDPLALRRDRFMAGGVKLRPALPLLWVVAEGTEGVALLDAGPLLYLLDNDLDDVFLVGFGLAAM